MIPTGITYDFVKSMYSQKQYIFREENEFANVFGYRSKDVLVDHFNDILGVAYKDAFGNPQCLIFPATTKPGLHYLKDELGNPEGTAILQPGQYIDCWMPGVHGKAAYPAWVQSGSGIFKIWRDKNQDGKFDFSGDTFSNVAGLDGHTVRPDEDVNDVVANASAGCQVIRDGRHHKVWYYTGLRTLEVFKKQKIDYTLFQEA